MLTRYCGIEVTDAELGFDHMIIQSNKLHVVGSLHFRLLPRDCIQIQALNPRTHTILVLGHRASLIEMVITRLLHKLP